MRRLPIVLVAAAALAGACTGEIIGSGDPSGPDGPGGPGDGDPSTPDDPDPIAPQDPDYATDHPRIYLPRNHDRLVAALDAPAGQRFRSIVASEMNGGDVYDFQAWFAALLGALTGDASYCDFAVARVDAFVASEEAMIAAGDRPSVSGDSYLEVGAKIGDVMMTYDWCFDATSASQRERWTAYADQAIWNVWHPEEATWGGNAFPWSGWSIDNPSNNYYYSFLRATMLFGLAARDEHPAAQGWLDFFREQKMQAQLLPTFEEQLQGGGSREGTGYGVAMHLLWWLYDLWHGSTGEDLARQTTHTRASMLNMIHSIVPTLDRLAPIGDHARDATAALFDYHRNYLQGLAYLFRDDDLAPRAKYLLENCSVPEMDMGFMAVFDFFYDNPDLASAPLAALPTHYYAPGIGELYARSSWDADATWFNLIAGPYTESHAHRDQGSFMLYKGTWLAYDANVESHSGIEQAEALHNLVRITDGGSTVSQHEGTVSELTALHTGEGWVHTAADLTAAYGGNDAVQNVEREIVFIEPDVLVVFDRVATAAGTQQIWQLNTPVAPTTSGNRTTISTGGHQLVVTRLLPESATTSVHSWANAGDFGGGYRHDVTVAGGAQLHLNVLSVDGAATSVTRSDAGGRTGVTIALEDGRTATVRFGTSSVDTTLEITPGVSETLGPTIDQ